MLVKSSAIVISSIKYGDNGKIIKFYTGTSGIKTFIAKGVYSKRNKINSLLSPLNQVELIFDNKLKPGLGYFKEIRQDFLYTDIYKSPRKSSIALFLSEILNSVLNEEESNPELFDFISGTLKIFDSKPENYSDFHLWFLINLSRYLGFYPNLKNPSNYFDLVDGTYSIEIPNQIFITDDDLQNFEKLLLLDFYPDSKNEFNQKQRKSLLSTLMSYFELHISDFRHPKSLEVLGVIFD